MTREQALNYMKGSGFSEEQIQAIIEALGYKPKIGHWLKHETNFMTFRECSCCKCYFSWEMPRNSFCPNCGADMRKDKRNATNNFNN